MLDSRSETFKLIGRNASDFIVANISQIENLSNFTDKSKSERMIIDSKELDENDQDLEYDNEKTKTSLDSESDYQTAHKRICLINSLSQTRLGSARFDDVNTNLCSHIVFASANVNEVDETIPIFNLKPMQKTDFSIK